MRMTKTLTPGGPLTTPILTPIDLQEEEELLTRLKQWGKLESEYPPKLFAATRAAILARVEQEKSVEAHTRRVPG